MNNRKMITILMGVIIVILAVLCVLFATNKITFNSKVDKDLSQNTSAKENTDQKENNTPKEKEILSLYTSGDDNAMKGNPETLKIYSMDDTKLDFQYHAVWNKKDISGIAQKTETNKYVYVYEENNYKIELNFNEDSIEVKEYTNEQLTSTVNLFK